MAFVAPVLHLWRDASSSTQDSGARVRPKRLGPYWHVTSQGPGFLATPRRTK